MSASFPVTDDTRWRISTAVAGQTAFSVPFPFQERGDVVVWKQSVGGLISVLTLDVHYTIAGAGNPGGGTVTLTAGAAAGEKIYRIGQATLDRLTSVVRNGKFSSEALDEDLDRTVITLQEFRRDVSRAWVVAFGQTAGSITVGRPGYVPVFDLNGNIVEGPDAGTIQSAQGYAEVALASAGAAAQNASDASSAAGAAAAAAGSANASAGVAAAARAVVEGLASGISYIDSHRVEVEAAAASALFFASIQAQAYKWTSAAGQSLFTGVSGSPARTTNLPGKAYCFVNFNGRMLLQDEFSIVNGKDIQVAFADAEAGEVVELVVHSLNPVNTPAPGSVTPDILSNDVFTNNKLAFMAQATVKGRASGAGSGNPVDLTPSQLWAILSQFANLSPWDAIVEDRKPSGTAGGTSGAAAGVWADRTLNNVHYNPRGFITELTGNKFKLAAGKYAIEWRAPGSYCSGFKSRLVDEVGAILAYSTMAHSEQGTGAWASTHSFGEVEVTTDGSKYYGVQQAYNSGYGNAFGVAAGFTNTDEIYTRVKIKRIG